MNESTNISGRDEQLFSSKVSQLELNVPYTCETDIRNKLISLFNPLLENTDYYFKINTTDSSGKILEVYREGNPKRIMGISGKRNMIIGVFFNPDLYAELRKKIDIPDNQKAYRSQPHVRISLEHLWNIMCVLTHKEQYRLDESKMIERTPGENTNESGNIITRESLIHNIIVIKINQLYQEGMSPEALYEATRGIWKIKIERAERADYALSVYKGIVKEVYKIDSWYPAGTTKYNTRTLNKERCIGRAEFIGRVASSDIRKCYIGKSIAPLFKFGEASPVKVIEKYQEGLDYGSYAIGTSKSGSSFLDNQEYEFVKDLHPSGKNKVILVKRKSDDSLWVGKEYTEYNKNVFDRICKLNVRGIPCYEMCEERDGVLFTLEEYIEGRDLKSIFDKDGLFDDKTVRQIALQLCDILEKIHALEPPMIHRDIKPSNIIMSDNGDVSLIDFNATKEYHEGNTQDTVLLGTHYFAAPEQILGYGASDVTTDIFGLGATMNYLLTGMYVKNFLAPGPLESIIKKCTRMEKEDRYESVKELRMALLKVKAV